MVLGLEAELDLWSDGGVEVKSEIFSNLHLEFKLIIMEIYLNPNKNLNFSHATITLCGINLKVLMWLRVL